MANIMASFVREDKIDDAIRAADEGLRILGVGRAGQSLEVPTTDDAVFLSGQIVGEI